MTALADDGGQVIDIGRPDEARTGKTRDLALLAEASRMLERAQSIPELTELRDQSIALSHYLRRKRSAEEACRFAMEIRLRAERRLGEFLRETVRHTGGRPKTVDSIDRLPEGVSKTQSSQWQRIASLPGPRFELELKGQAPTTARMLRVARELSGAKPKPMRPSERPFLELFRMCLSIKVMEWADGLPEQMRRGMADRLSAIVTREYEEEREAAERD